jgi:hypothetical protein
MFARRAMFLVAMLSVLVSQAQKSDQKPRPRPAQQRASLEDLSWLTGCWEGRQGKAVRDEIWSKPGGGSMLGLGRTRQG